MKTVLFVCTGNYYRSRFAEELFNHLAKSRRLAWAAVSRGLAIERGFNNKGPISAYATVALQERTIPIRGIDRMPCRCTDRDLESAALIVALDEDEHRPLIIERFPSWDGRVKYWRVKDIEDISPAIALAEIERQVSALVAKLR